MFPPGSLTSSVSRGALGALVLAFATACGGQKPAEAPLSSATDPGRIQGPATNVPRMREPEGLVFVARIKSYKELFGLSETPPALKALLEEEATKHERARAVMWDESFELAVLYDPDAAEGPGEFERFRVAVSMPINRFDETLLDEDERTKLSDDAYANDDCVLARSLGPSPARLVCGDGAQGDGRLYRYMARGLPVTPLVDAPLYAELRFEPFRDELLELGRKLRSSRRELERESPIAGGRLQDALLEVYDSFVEEVDVWARSVDKVSILGWRSPSDTLELSVRLATRDPQPFLMAATQRAARGKSGPPTDFFRLPLDATGAGFSHGFLERDVRVMQRPIEGLWKAVEEELKPFLSNPGLASLVPGGTFEQVAALVNSRCWQASHLVWAAGDLESGSDVGSSPDDLVRNYLGWGLAGMPRAARCGALLTELLDWGLGVYDRYGESAGMKPEGLRLAKGKALPALGPGASVYELSVSPDLLNDAFASELEDMAAAWGASMKGEDDAPESPQIKKAFDLYLFVVSDQTTDWFGYGTDRKALERRMQALRESKPDAGWRSKKELAPLLQPQLTRGAFETVPRPSALDPWPAKVMDAVEMVPEGFFGSPVVWTTGVKREGRRMSYDMRFTVPTSMLRAVREIFGWEVERFRSIGAALKEADPEVLEGPVGIIEKVR